MGAVWAAVPLILLSDDKLWGSPDLSPKPFYLLTLNRLQDGINITFIFTEHIFWLRISVLKGTLECCYFSVVSDSLQPHGLQHTRLPCPSPSPGACSNSCPLSRWCLPIISSSFIPLSCLLSFPASGSFPMSQRFASGGQSIRASPSEHQSF